MGPGRVPSARFLSSRSLSRLGLSSPISLIHRRFFTTPQHPIARAKLVKSLFRKRATLSSRFERRFIFRSFRFNSSRSSSPKTNSVQSSPTAEPSLSLSQRLRKLSREYGWSALGVYFALTALDFPFCFLGVRMLGTDRIGHYEEVVLEAFWKVVRIPFPNLARKGHAEGSIEGSAHTGDGEDHLGWSDEVAEAARTNSGAEASIWTQLALAYAIHKSFIFIRVPLTAAITPNVVKTLRKWGWNIGKRKPKADIPK